MRFLSLALFSVVILACNGRDPAFKQPIKLAGKMVSAETLNTGHRVYLQYCRACHGDKGEGNGPASEGLRPPPRNFTQGEFKFGGVLDQKLPRDEDLKRIIKMNLHGSAMLGWQLPEPELDAVVQYLKTFSKKWADDDAMGDPVVPTPDPWGGKEHEAIARGKLLFHGYAECLNCHPAYASKEEISAASRELKGTPKNDFRSNMFLPALKQTDYKTAKGQPVQVLPPDFLYNPVRTIQPDTALTDLYRILVAGVTGAAMPAWDPEVMPNKGDDIWALAYYVRSLIALRGTPAAVALHEQLLLLDKPSPAASP